MYSQQHIPMSLNELRREAEYSDNKLGLRIIEQYDNELDEQLQEQSANKRTVRDEINGYVVGNLDEVGDYIARLITDIRKGKGGVRASAKAAEDFQQCVEENIGVDSYEVLSSMLDKIVKACQ